MSGQCTGWVLKNGPRNRAMRAVLITIADAANSNGEHAHPGIEAMCEGSLYSRTHVKAIVKRLVEQGWLKVESGEKGGRGIATVLSVLMEERVQLATPLEDTAEPGRGHSEDVKGTLSARKGDTPGATPNVKNNVKEQQDQDLATRAVAKPTDDPVTKHAHRLAVLAFEQPVKPVSNFAVVMARVEEQLRAGQSVQVIERVITARCDPIVWTRDGLQTAVSRAASRARPRHNEQGAVSLVEQIKQARTQEAQTETLEAHTRELTR